MATSSDRLFQLTMVFRKYEYFLSIIIRMAVMHQVGKWTSLLTETLGWFLFAVNGNHSVVELVKVGEPGDSVSVLQR